MRIRTIKPEFWSNEALSRLPEATHMLAAGLLNYADDEGYFNANPGLIKAALLPLREPSVSVHESLNLLSKVGFVKLSASEDGRCYGWIVKFSDHQAVNRPTPSKIKKLGLVWDDSLPTQLQLTEDSHQEQGTGNREQGKEKALAQGSADAAPAQVDQHAAFHLPLLGGHEHGVTQERIDEWQAAYPAITIMAELRKMRVWLLSNPKNLKTRAGINRFINSWLDRSQNSAVLVPRGTARTGPGSARLQVSSATTEAEYTEGL